VDLDLNWDLDLRVVDLDLAIGGLVTSLHFAHYILHSKDLQDPDPEFLKSL